MNDWAFTIAVGWLVLWVYWITAAFGSKKSIKSFNTKEFVIGRIILITLAVLVTAIFELLPAAFKGRAIGTTEPFKIVGFALFLVGLLLSVRARLSLGKNWGMPMTEKREPELVTAGPYRFVRHPIYTGLLLMALGSAITVNSYWLIVLIVASIYFIYSAFAEEKLLGKQFPKTYPAYKAKTKMLIPFIL